MNATPGTTRQPRGHRRAHTRSKPNTSSSKLLRMPGYAMPSIAFPAMFYLLFGIMFGGGHRAGGTTMATYLIATYGAFGVIGAALFGFGVGVAVERGQGWMTLKRATPMPPLAVLRRQARYVRHLRRRRLCAVLSMGSVSRSDTSTATATWIRLASTLVLGAIPFCALGLGLGYIVGPNSAPPIVNLIYLPMSFLSGLWIPFEILPPAVNDRAVPARRSISASSRSGRSAWVPARQRGVTSLALAGFTLIGLGARDVGLSAR